MSPRSSDSLRARQSRAAHAGFALLTSASVVAVGGCAPMLATVVQPQARGGTVVNRMCPPVPDVLLFEQDGVVAAVFMVEAGAGRRAIWLSFEVPAGRSVRLHAPTLEVTTRRGERVASRMSGTWEGSGNRSAQVRPESLMVGHTKRLRVGTRTIHGMTRHDCFSFSSEFATALGDTFTVTLPKASVNGFSWDLPPVEFKRVKRWVISPFNC